MNDYFVMLTTQNGAAVIMTEGDDNHVGFYPTEDKARAAAKTTFLGQEFGFEVFCLGCREYQG